MTGYLLDTNRVSAVLKNHVHVLARMRAPNQAEYGVALPAVGELWYMVFNSARVAQNTADLQRVLQDFRLWAFDLAAAADFGRISGVAPRRTPYPRRRCPNRRHRSLQWTHLVISRCTLRVRFGPCCGGLVDWAVRSLA